MSSMTKIDRVRLRGVAIILSNNANEFDERADELLDLGFPGRCEALRKIAEMMRVEAAECRSRADQEIDQ